MQRSPLLFVAAIGLAGSLAGCARDTENYPSLSPRAVEKLGFAEPEPDAAPVAFKADPALDATIADDRRQLATIASGFAEAATRSETAVRGARGRAVGSDAWLEAQTSLASLDDYRAQASSLATDVDTLITNRAAELAPVYPGLAELRSQVQAEADKQGATIDRLQATLPTG